jgi:hypothetical protein
LSGRAKSRPHFISIITKKPLDCLPDCVIQAGLPDCVIQAGLPDCVIQASLPDKSFSRALEVTLE